ncbi:MAG: sensor histidine kinase [Oscillospiraceae bacterium]
MRKRIVNALCTIAAMVAAAVTASLYLLERYWLRNRPDAPVWGSEYTFYAFLLILAVLAFGIMLSLILANSIIRPLERSEDDYVELSSLKRRLDAQSSQLRYSSDELEEKERNFSLVIANMSEGLILLDRKGIIVTMNNSACTLLGTEYGEFIGKHIYAANSDMALLAAVNEALGGKPARDVIEIGDCDIEVSVNPAVVEKVIRGAVVFLRDITERQEHERMRREFSANVSHELKTPLTSISGYAELLKEGMAQSQDIGWIAAKIYDETQRLISLTDDIMRLSRLDEGETTGMPMEELSLMPIVRDVMERLRTKAEEYEVSLSVSGDEGRVWGNPGLLDEMVANLCDNAIKYNKPGGSVDLSVRTSGEYVILTVADTGVGIPREHQGRVFERFYRVDKSHSKATGGTGLGLSIVKNGAIFHNARVELSSKAGEGTTIRLIFKRL